MHGSKSRIALGGILVACLLTLRSQSQTAADLKLYVGNSRGDDVSIIDMQSLKVVGQIKVADRIHGVCVQADGKRLFVTVESDDTLRIIDPVSQAIVGTVKLSGRPNQCAVTPNGKYVVVPIRDRDRVDVVDTEKEQIAKSLPLKEPHNALNTGSNRYIYVSSMGSDEIDLMDLDKLDYAAHIPAGGRPRPYVISPDGKTMFVAVANLHGFVIVDLPRRTVIERVEMPAEHPTPHPLRYETPDTRTHGLAITPDSGELWVTSLLDDCVYIYDLKAKKIVGKVATGGGPNWVVITADGKYVCVSNADSNDVSIIDGHARREVTRVKVGKAPKRLALASVPSAGRGQH